MSSIERQGRDKKELSLSVVVALAGLTLAFLVQFGGTIWWGATLSANVISIKETLQRMDSEKYTHSDALRDQARLDQRDSAMDARLTELRGRVIQLEDMVPRVVNHSRQ